jgi:hypothetical protein
MQSAPRPQRELTSRSRLRRRPCPSAGDEIARGETGGEFAGTPSCEDERESMSGLVVGAISCEDETRTLNVAQLGQKLLLTQEEYAMISL